LRLPLLLQLRLQLSHLLAQEDYFVAELLFTLFGVIHKSDSVSLTSVKFILMFTQK
jgi:hypothetical protein